MVRQVAAAYLLFEGGCQQKHALCFAQVVIDLFEGQSPGPQSIDNIVLKHLQHNFQALADHIVMGQLPIDNSLEQQHPLIEPEAIQQSSQIKHPLQMGIREPAQKEGQHLMLLSSAAGQQAAPDRAGLSAFLDECSEKVVPLAGGEPAAVEHF